MYISHFFQFFIDPLQLSRHLSGVGVEQLLPSTSNSLLLLVLLKNETRNHSIVSYLMMANDIAESARRNTVGGLLHLFHPDTKNMARKLERINEKLVRHELSVQFNKTCIKEKMLPKYTYIRNKDFHIIWPHCRLRR